MADDDRVTVRLRTKRGDVDDCTLLWGDKYDWRASAERSALERVRRDETSDYWEVTVEPPHRRLWYVFRLEDDEESLWYTERGFDPADGTRFPPNGDDQPGPYFEYPFLHPVDRIDPPEWVADAVFYQIFPERFANGDPSLDPEGVEPWEGRPDRDTFHGGDLRGIVDNLDHLEALGITALYLTPVFESPSNHKYNTADYYRIDPQFGDEETLRELVEAAHDRGMRVVLDAVFNHCGSQFEPFLDVVDRGGDSPYADWFHVEEFPIEHSRPPNYHSFAFTQYMPKLDTSNPEVREYLLDVATHWMESVGVDGWRLDVANEVDHRFWREFRDAVKAVDPDCFILGEVWHDPSPWLRGDQFDSAMNYPYSDAIYEFLVEDRVDGTGFADRIDGLLMRHPDPINDVLFDLLDSHDTPRALRRCDDDERLFRLAVLCQLTAPGTPCIYYGDEVGMTGDDDPDCRRPMTWDEDDQNRELLAFYRDLVGLRRDSHAIRRGELRFDREACSEDVVVYRREGEDGTDVVALNRGESPVTVSGPSVETAEGIALSTIGSDREASVSLTGEGLELPALAGAILHDGS